MFDIKIPSSLVSSFNLSQPITAHVVYRNHYLLTFYSEEGKSVFTKQKYDVEVIPNVEVRWSDREGLIFIRGDFIVYLFLSQIFVQKEAQ